MYALNTAMCHCCHAEKQKFWNTDISKLISVSMLIYLAFLLIVLVSRHLSPWILLWSRLIEFLCPRHKICKECGKWRTLTLGTRKKSENKTQYARKKSARRNRYGNDMLLFFTVSWVNSPASCSGKEFGGIGDFYFTFCYISRFYPGLDCLFSP